MKRGKISNNILFSNPASTDKREKMTIKLSENNGETWFYAYQVYSGPSAYSDLTNLGNGNIGLLYEYGINNPYEKIGFTIIPFKQMRSVLLLLLSFFTPVIWAQNVEQSKLWPDKQNANEAEIYIYHPKESDKVAPAVLICPGGGYSGLAMDREGHDMAKWYASNGFVAVVLKYRMPKGVHTVPLEDAEKAISVLRENADKWNLDKSKVGVVGSSAGGHLAASLSTLAKDINRPDFAILYYPVISFDNKMAHQGSKKNLLGKNIDNEKLIDYYSLNKQVDDKTPKTLLLLSYDDRVVPPMNSILYYIALNEHHIPASLHMFPNGGHGWGIRYDFAYYQEVKDLILKWLRYTQIID